MVNIIGCRSLKSTIKMILNVKIAHMGLILLHLSYFGNRAVVLLCLPGETGDWNTFLIRYKMHGLLTDQSLALIGP